MSDAPVSRPLVTRRSVHAETEDGHYLSGTAVPWPGPLGRASSSRAGPGAVGRAARRPRGCAAQIMAPMRAAMSASCC
jgi:hypothetical protein